MLFLKKFWQCITVWHLKGTDLKGADVIITHAGGEAKDGSPGKINAYLELVVRTLYIKNQLPIVAQGELARCIDDLPLVGNIPRQADSDSYIDSVEVAKIHKRICDENGWKHPILVSYQPHLWRGLMVSKMVGLSDIRLIETKSIYDNNCSQWWMRSPWFNTPRELLVRILWLLQGKI